MAVTCARFMLLFVWRLDTVRLLWAFAVVGETKECVRSCLSDVVAELNSYTGGSKSPVLRIHSDQAREFLSQPVMEWLMHHNIKQTLTSTGDPSANGVAERWIDLGKVKATVLVASRYSPTTLWCYTPSRALKRTRQQVSAVAQKVLAAKPTVSAVCLLDQGNETSGCTVLSDAITKRWIRRRGSTRRQ